MGSNLVIVALPADDDPVWKVSSEKKPHLTLLFLGEADTNPNTQRIISFVEHAVGICEHGSFYMDVDYRGTLGPDEADVFFFRKDWSAKWITQFRNQLLQEPNIKTAYDSTTQYEEWTPHLTLGYPSTPAHNDKMPEYGISLVRFDRIAVWTGDYEGTEFRLEWPERMDELAIAYSSMNDARIAAGLEALEHHGIKGMKWGIRKVRQADRVNRPLTEGQLKFHTSRSEKRAAKQAAKADKKWEQNIYSVRGAVAVHNAMAEHFNARISVVNDKYKNDDFSKTKYDDPTSWTSREKQYINEVNALTIEGNRLAVKAVHGTSPSGKLRAELTPDGERIIVREVQVKHAAMTDAVAVLKLTRNAKGLIIKAEPLTETDLGGGSLAQTAVYGEAFIGGLMRSNVSDLTHYGIKGMRWGHRKAEPTAVMPSAASRVPHGDKRKTKIQVEGGQNHPAHEDAIKVAEARAKLAKSGPAALSNKELRDVATRIQLEQQVKTLTRSSGHRFVRNLLGQQGKETTKQVVGKQVKKKLATAALI